MVRALGIAILTAVTVVAVAELAARAVMSRVEFAHSYDTPRNPNNRRAWPAYTAPRDRRVDQKLIILISNSQGYAPELDDGRLAYAHQLELLLEQSDPDHDYIVANWSVGGSSGPEMLLHAVRAADHKPDLLLIVTHSNPFADTRLREPLSFFISDSNQLAYDRAIRDRLPARFIRDHRAYDPTNYLQTHAGLMRARDAFVEQRTGRWVQPARPDGIKPRPINPRKLQGAPVMREQGQRLLESIVDVFHEARPTTPVLAVSMPLCQPRWKPDAWRRLAGFGGELTTLYADRPNVTVLDAVDAVDPDLFITHTHMLPAGHAHFAGWLLAHVEAGLKASDPQAASATTQPPTHEP